MTNETQVVCIISTASGTLEGASKLLSLANARSDCAETLAACSAVMSAAALEQGILSVLSYVATNHAVAHGVPLSATPYACALEQSLRQRMEQTPHLLSGGVYILDPNSRATRALHNLISVRNRLMHIDEARRFFGPEVSLQTTETHATLRIPMPTNPWSSVKLKEAFFY